MSQSLKLPSTSLEQLARFIPGTAMETLGIQFTAATSEYLEATMPVDARTAQPYGYLHGGASALLAETLASVGAVLFVDPAKCRCFGIELNINHLSAVRSGTVIGRATPLHIGRTTQVWDIQIRSDAGKRVAVSRLTIAVSERDLA